MKKWLRNKLNLDGPWYCISCGTRTVVRQDDGNDLCIKCNQHQCSCELGGWGSDPWTNPKCAQHGHLTIPDPLEVKAMELSRA